MSNEPKEPPARAKLPSQRLLEAGWVRDPCDDRDNYLVDWIDPVTEKFINFYTALDMLFSRSATMPDTSLKVRFGRCWVNDIHGHGLMAGTPRKASIMTGLSETFIRKHWHKTLAQDFVDVAMKAPGVLFFTAKTIHSAADFKQVTPAPGAAQVE